MHVGVMPEGHTIHRAARDQMLALGGQSVRVTSPQGRFDMTKLSARGRVKLLRVEAYGKHLFYVFEKKLTVHVHLGLFGKFYRHKTPAPPPRDTVRMRMEGDVATIDLVGPTACALVSESEKAAILARIGPDPLNADADPNIFYDAIAKSKAPIGALLMDQSVVSGIGNVYRAEVLHLLKIHPEIPGRAISPKTAKKMWTLMVGLLARGVEEKRIVTTQGLKIAKGGKRMLRSESVHVYRRSTCRSCGGNVQKYLLRARSAYVCTACQPYRSAV
jgi:formamidopyrimidine-DNA glycosylase